MPRLVALVVLAGCTRVDGAPSPPSPRPPAALIPIDAAPPPIDAMVTPMHTYLHVRDFSEEAYYGAAAIEHPGLPAYDPTTRTVAIAFGDEDGLSTMPNIAVRFLDPATARVRKTIPIWSQAQSRSFMGQAEATPDKLRELERAIDAEIVTAETKLFGFVPMTACKPDEDAPQTDDKTEAYLPYCGGHPVWQCDDAVITYLRDGQGNPKPALTIAAHGKTSKVDTRAWRKPPVQIYSGSQPIDMKIDTVNCIGEAHLIPNSRDVLVELWHACNTGGDWCGAGAPTWQVLHLP